MNINEPLDAPRVVETAADALSLVAAHRVGSTVYHASRSNNAITKLLVQVIQLTVGPRGNIDVRYQCVHPNTPGKSGDWITDAHNLFGDVESAMSAIWHRV